MRVAPAVAGQPYRYTYVVAGADGERGELLRNVAKVDVETGHSTTIALGATQYPSEPVFVPRPGAMAEDDGYLLTLVYDAVSHHSHLTVLDARDLQRGPLARAWFDHHIPFTFHGIWVA